MNDEPHWPDDVRLALGLPLLTTEADLPPYVREKIASVGVRMDGSYWSGVNRALALYNVLCAMDAEEWWRDVCTGRVDKRRTLF